MNIADSLNLLRFLNTVAAFAITTLSLKKSNENQVFRPIAYLSAMFGFWNLMRLFLLQANDPQLYFFMVRYIFVCIAFSALFLFHYAQAYCIPNFPPIFCKLTVVIPIITSILSVTADLHPFFIGLEPDVAGFNGARDSINYGLWFYVHAIYSYLLIAFSFILFVIKVCSPKIKNRGPIIAVTMAGLFFMIMNITNTFIMQTDLTLLLGIISHLLIINAFYFLTSLDMDQQLIYYGKKDFFRNFGQPVLIFNMKNELLRANKEALRFFGKAHIESRMYTLYEDMFSERFFVPIKNREQNDSVLYLQHIATGRVFLCRKRIIWNLKNKKRVGTTIMMYDASMLGNLIQKIEENAFTDILCSCLNRTCFEMRKESIIRTIQKPCLLLVADIDNLKKVNDKFGHVAGDEYIQTCAAILKRAVKAPSGLFRIGGDEFVTFIPYFAGTDTEVLIKKIEALCAKQEKPWKVSIAVGFSIIETDNADIAAHFAEADGHMYLYKQTHKELSPFKADTRSAQIA